MRVTSDVLLGWLKGLPSLVYPDSCSLCGRIAEPPICQYCRDELSSLAAEFQPRLDFRPLADVYCLFAYEGRAAQAVKGLKYHRRTSLFGPMAELMAARQREIGPFDLIVPVPIHWTRLKVRGFNQSEGLCEAMPNDRVDSELLIRTKRTKPQVGLNHEQRQTNLDQAFQARDCKGQNILLVDDVITSGGTGKECARTLLAAGAKSVSLLAFAGWKAEPNYNEP